MLHKSLPNKTKDMKRLKMLPAPAKLSSYFTRGSKNRIFSKGWMPRAVKPNWVGGPLRRNYCVILAKLSLLSQKLNPGSPH